MDAQRRNAVATSYDAVADEYVRRIFDELKDKPLDRSLLDRFAEALAGGGPACDMGCGPGHVARYLHERGVEVTGIDLSREMVARARALNPGIEFREADMTAPDVADGAWAGIVAFYSIIHVPRQDTVPALRQWLRVLRPGGLLLLAFHVGDDAVRLDDWWGHKVSVDFFFFQPNDIAGALWAAGFDVEEIIEREPYPAVEYPSRRAYVFARKPRDTRG